jgi:hypothetical protein
MQKFLLPNVTKYMGKFLPNTSTEKLGEDNVLTCVIAHKVKHPVQAFFCQVKRAGRGGNCLIFR